MADDPWYIEFNGAFWLTISASLFALLGMALNACLKSRCTKINCCSSKGVVACEREPVADEFTDLERGNNIPTARNAQEKGTDLLKK